MRRAGDMVSQVLVPGLCSCGNCARRPMTSHLPEAPSTMEKKLGTARHFRYVPAGTTCHSHHHHTTGIFTLRKAHPAGHSFSCRVWSWCCWITVHALLLRRTRAVIIGGSSTWSRSVKHNSTDSEQGIGNQPWEQEKKMQLFILSI